MVALTRLGGVWPRPVREHPTAVATPSFTLVRDDGAVVCRSCRSAATFFSRLRGLLGRRGLAEHEGLLIRPTSSIHTVRARRCVSRPRRLCGQARAGPAPVARQLRPRRPQRARALGRRDRTAGAARRRHPAACRRPRIMTAEESAASAPALGRGQHAGGEVAVLLSASAVSLLCLLHAGLSGRGALEAFVGFVLVRLAAIDVRLRILPDRIVLPATAVTLVAQAALAPERTPEWLLAALGASLFLLVPALIRPEALGMGHGADPRLARGRGVRRPAVARSGPPRSEVDDAPRAVPRPRRNPRATGAVGGRAPACACGRPALSETAGRGSRQQT